MMKSFLKHLPACGIIFSLVGEVLYQSEKFNYRT